MAEVQNCSTVLVIVSATQSQMVPSMTVCPWHEFKLYIYRYRSRLISILFLIIV